MKPTLNPHLTRVAALWLLAAATGVQAQVLEIGSGGAVVVHDRPEITVSSGATPIVVPPRPQSRRRMRNTGQESRVDAAALEQAAGGVALSPDLVEAVAWRESRLRHDVVSPKGAIGAMQLMPGTAQTLGVDPHDGNQNLRGGAAYLRALLQRYDGDVVKTLAAYNAGPGAVDRYRGMPPFKETRDYVAAVLDHMSQRAVGAAAPSGR